jgi:hypothetical protein
MSVCICVSIWWPCFSFGFFYLCQGESKIIRVLELPIFKKRVRKISEQGARESRKLWYNVTKALKMGDIDSATEYKQRVSSVLYMCFS